MVWKKVGKVMRNVKILKSGKWRFLKGKYHGHKSSSRASSPKHHSGRKTSMTKKKRHGGSGGTRSLYKLLRLGSLVAPTIYYATIPGWETSRKLNNIMLAYTGFDHDDMKWKPAFMLRGWGGFIGASLATYGIPKLANIIRRL